MEVDLYPGRLVDGARGGEWLHERPLVGKRKASQS